MLFIKKIKTMKIQVFINILLNKFYYFFIHYLSLIIFGENNMINNVRTFELIEEKSKKKIKTSKGIIGTKISEK
jgi:hypothetical protein